MMVHKMTIDLDVFCAFIKYIVMSDLDSTMIVTIKRSARGLRNTHILEKPKKLRSSVNKGSILSLDDRASNHGLLFAPPIGKGVTK